MRNLILILSLCLLPNGLLGEINSKFHWKPIHTSFDLIVDSLERGFVSDNSNEHREKQVRQLYQLANQHPKKAVFKWRADFWNARLQLKKNNVDSAVNLIGKTLVLVDSVNYVFDYMRIWHLWSILYKDSSHLIYKNLKKISDYYEQTDDHFMLAHSYMDLGNILNRLNDYPKAMEYYLKADTLYGQMGNSIYRSKNQLNISNALYLMNQKDEADQILKILLKKPVCIKDTSFYINILHSLAEHNLFLNSRYLFQAYELSLIFGNKGLLIRSETFMGNYYQNINRPDSALYYYRKVERNAKVRLTDLLAPVLKKMSECFFTLHVPDSAYLYLRKYGQLEDSLGQVNSLAEIRRIENRASIEKYELELKQRKERADFYFVLVLMVCFFVVCFACMVCYIFWKKHREIQIKRQLDSSEKKELSIRLEHEALQSDYFKMELKSRERELVSNSLLMIEKNQVLEALLEQIETETETGNIDLATASKIIRNVKRCQGNGDEWEFFRIQFEKVHPEFFTKLKKLYPSITEGELRICSYIRIGMENKQIAQILSLQPDSVKKTRYRIRKKLGTELGESLENLLREI